jgi:cysteine desulfurase/selenocysteine lyase
MYKNDFPLLVNQANLVYLDSAATTQKPQVVLDAIQHFYRNTNANVHRGNYALSELATDTYERARETVAKFINATSNEIIFTSGTTDSINKIALSLGFEIEANSTILLTEAEHHSNLIPWQQLALQHKLNLQYVQLDSEYRLDLNDLYQKVSKYQPAVLAISQMSNVTGVINPLREIISKVRELSKDTIVVVDAAQSIPHMQVDVKDLDCDCLAFSGHKMFAPTGIGVLYVKTSLLNKLQPSVFGGGMIKKVERMNSTWEDIPSNFEAGTPNIEGAIVLASAMDYISEIGYSNIIKEEAELSQYFLEKVAQNTDLTIWGPKSCSNRGPVFSFTINGVHAHDAATILSEYDIAVRAGHHCTQILHREIFKIAASLRASLSIYNTKENIDRLFLALTEVQKKFLK